MAGRARRSDDGARILDDRNGPLYSERSERSLAAVALQALVELDRGLRTASASQI